MEKAWWDGDDSLEDEAEVVEETSHRDIAIIGMSVRLPGASDVQSLWELIAAGHDAIGPFPAARRDDVESLLSGTKLPEGKVSYYDGAYLDEIDKFDYRFFRMSPKEASLMSPNQRLWLETAWNALEDAGYGSNKLAGSRTGVYLGYNGDAFHDYKRLISERDPASLTMGITGNLSSIVASRISYLLDFKGPSLTVDTACSSSLVALHLAIQSLRAGECEQALVGGVKTYLLPVDLGIRIGIESPDFRARTFDDRSAGTGGGEGAAAVLLKPLGKALRDKDAIYAVIKGSAINQDGSSIGITAPNGRAQEEVIVQAWGDADIDPATIGYVEAHGTGTKLGDPIEIDGMTQAFRRYTRRSQFCAVGSAKTNFGHLDTTAGIVGLIKTALALHRRELPPMLHFREPNREIPFLDSPVYVSDILRPWVQDGENPRRAGVSSFGMSGTNAHAVLEEAPSIPRLRLANESGKVQTLALSAKSETALTALVVSYKRFLERHDDSSLSLGSLCYTANTGRGHYEFRAALTVGSIGQLQDKLRLLAKCLLEGKNRLAFGELEDKALEWEDGSGNPTGIWLGHHGGGNVMSASARAGSVDTLTENIRDSSVEKLCLAYVEGNQLDWEALYRDSRYGKIHLPSYPFDRTRCWVEERAAFPHYRMPNDNEGEMVLPETGEEDRNAVQLIGRADDRYSETEKTVALIWGRALGFESIGVYDHYYELGGDSILALQIVGGLSSSLGREIEIADLLSHPTVADLSVYIDGVMGKSSDTEEASQELIAYDSLVTYPLSRAQHRIFLGAQLPGTERHHHMPLAYTVEGELKADRLEMAFRKLAERHESLRTTFEWSEEGEPQQCVHPVPDMRVESSSVESEADWPAFTAAFIRPFDMSKLPLVRVGLATVSPKSHLLVLDAHHLVSDGASLALLLQELTALYEGISLPPKSMDYRHYVHWQQDQKDSPGWQAQRAYWLSDMLSPPIPRLRLPLDFPRPPVKSPVGKSFRFTLPGPLTDKLNQLARKRQVSLHTVLYSLYAVLMNRYSGQEELVIGSLVSGRDQAAFRQIVGVFINFLPVRIRISAQLSFDEFMAGIQDVTREAYANGLFPYDEMVAAAPAARDRSRNALYDTMLVFHNHSTGSDRFSSGGLLFSEYPLERTTSSLDVKLDLFPGAGGELHGVWEYDPQLFQELTISRMSEHFTVLAAMAADHSDWTIGEFRLFGADDEANLEIRRSLNDGFPQETVAGLDFNLSIASTFTSEPIARSLTRWLGEFGLKSKLSFAPYNQIVQHVIGERSGEMEGTGEANVLLIRPEDWVTKAATVDERLEQLESDLRRLMNLIGERAERGPYLVALMPFSGNGPFNELSEQAAGSFRERWSDLVLSTKNVYMLDFSATAARYQVAEIEDPIANEEGHIPYTEQYFAAIGTEVARALIAWRATPFKVIVVDADNTLWRGVCGEDGALNVQVTHEFAAWQQLLLRKRSEGMLLALCSKNNEDDLWEVFARNPGMTLRKEHFSAWRVNWVSKAENLRELSEELNVGLDSFIFVDDNAVECLSVMEGCPEVLTLKLPEDGEITAFLSHVWAWDRLNVTEEDRLRAGSYEAERRRKEAARPGETLDNYLQGLGMKVSMRALSSEDTDRAAQLSARTNQFNLNGIRRSKEDIRALLIVEGACQWIVEAADRYGDYGKIGYVSATRDGSSLILNAFLLSCRVLGRGVEQAICTGLKRFAMSLGCVELRADFRRTAKNRPFEQFLEDSGWVKGKAETGEDVYDCRISLIEVNEMPRHVAFYNGIPYEKEEAYELTAATGQGTRFVLEAEGQRSTKSFDWVLTYNRELELLHRAYYSPLRYPDASLIASLGDVNTETGNSAVALSYERPASDTESKIAELWAKLLGGGPYGRNDHFFAAGGDSLQAASLVSAFVRTFGVRVSLSDLFDNARLKEMAMLMNAESDVKKQTYEAIPIASEAELYPVSPAQRRMYFLQQFEPAGTAYQIPTALMLTGPVDRERMRQAFHELTRRHEGLRTSFILHKDEPYQSVHDAVNFEIVYKEMADNGELPEHALRAFVRPFDLSRAPLFRVGLFRVDQGRHVMLFDIHHIVADGVSVNVLMEDFLMLYEGRSLVTPELQYKDYSTWLLGEERAGRYGEQLDSWLLSFSEPLPKLELPADYARPEVKSTKGAQLLFRLSVKEAEQLNRLAQRSGTTLFMVLLTAYASWLMKLSGQTDLIIGTPVAGRSHPDTGKLVGVMVNPLAIRIAAAADFTFEELLGYVKETVINALDRQEAPFEELVERLRPERDLSRNPVFDTMFSMLNMFHADASSTEIRIEQLPIDFGVSQFDIGLYAVEEAQGLNFITQYASGLFSSGTMKRWVDGFQVLLGVISNNPELKLGDISLLSVEEHHQVVNMFNTTAAPYPRELTLPELFRRQAEIAPDKLAASFEASSLTYRELDERANRIALELIASGLRAGEPVGLMAERSPELLAGLLGILKAGGAYVPLPPDFPEERLRYMAANSGIELVCSQRDWLNIAGSAVPGAVLIDLDDAAWREGPSEAPDVDISPEQVAYILYTSGSTGRPKGVMIRHRSVINRIHWMQKAYPLGEDDVILQKTPYSFDVSVWELFWWMFAGASVAFLAPGAEKDPGLLIEAVHRHRVSTMHFVPSMLAVFLEAAHGEPSERLKAKLATLGRVFASGEALHKAHVERFYALTSAMGMSDTRLVNLYGPTEATVDVSVHECAPDSALDFVPIGRPIDNTSLYVMNVGGQAAQPIGVPGELCIAGVQLAVGYANEPELTAEKFVPNPFAAGELMYRTGDLARWMADGQIEYLGRIDDQVKIRGYRIELGEIERTLLLHEAVSECAVTARDDGAGGRRLCAYVVADRECTSGELRRHCGERLPEYMIPASFTQLEVMPLTASGKTSRKALPAPEASMATGTAYAAPGNETEEKLIGIWQELLQVQSIGIDDNFFELGGHSLKAATLSARIEQVFSVRLSLKEIFVHPTIRYLAERLSSENMERAYPPIQPAPRKDYYDVSTAQEQMLIHQRRNPSSLSYNMPSLMLLIGIPDIAKLRDRLGKLMVRHESLRTSFVQIDGRMVQRVSTDVAIPFHQIDKTEFFGNRPGNWEASASAWVRPFDLSEAPLFRVSLVSLEADRHLLLLDIHHTISDGVTTVILIRDLIALYEDKTLPSVKAQLKDYSEWLSAYLSGEELERHRAYWLSRFAEGVPRMELPYDTTRESISDPASLDESERYRWTLSDELKASLEQLANNSGSTLFMVLLASYQAMLSHWSGSSEVVTGVPAAGRSHPDLADTAGLLLQTMAICNRIDPSESFVNLLSIVKESMLQAFDHSWLPIEELVELLDERGLIRWETNRNPLFDTLFVMQNMDSSPIATGELGWQVLEWDGASAKMDLVLQAEEKNGKLQLSFEYRSRLFEADTVAQMANGLQGLLARVAVESHESLRKLTALQEESGKSKVQSAGHSMELFETGFDF